MLSIYDVLLPLLNVVTPIALVVVCLLACCKAVSKGQFLFEACFAFTFVFVVVLAAIGFSAIISRVVLKDAFSNSITDYVQNYYKDLGSMFVMDSIQTDYECCGGGKGILDYKGKVPETCYMKGTRLPYSTNCPTALFDFFKEDVVKIGGVAVAVSFVMLIGLSCSCCLLCAIRKKQCLLGMFFVFLFVVFVALAAQGKWAFASKDALKEAATKFITDCVEGYYRIRGINILMDSIQTDFECCGGRRGILDYKGNVPETCYMKDTTLPYARNCPSALFDFMNEHISKIVGVAVGVGIVMLVGMSWICCLLYTIRRRT